MPGRIADYRIAGVSPATRRQARRFVRAFAAAAFILIGILMLAGKF